MLYVVPHGGILALINDLMYCSFGVLVLLIRRDWQRDTTAAQLQVQYDGERTAQYTTLHYTAA